MKLVKKFLLLILLLFTAACHGQELELRLFGSHGCMQCERVENGVIQEIKKLYPKVRIEKILADDLAGFENSLRLKMLIKSIAMSR